MKNKIKIALVSNDKVGSVMAGPGIRYWELAKAFSSHFPTVLFVPDSCDMKSDSFEIKTYESQKASGSIGKQLGGVSHIIAQSLRPPLLSKINKENIVYIADLYDPLVIEVLEYTRYDSAAVKNTTFMFNYYSLMLQIHAASHLLCSSEEQKSYYLGLLSGQKLIGPTEYSDSPDFSKYISIAPFGMQDKLSPANDTEALEKRFPNIKKSDHIIYWGGGVWNWFDPISVIRALEIIARKRDDVKLFFVGVKHPNPKIKDMEMAAKAVEYCKEKDLIDKVVFFNFDWTPYEERINFLKRAKIGVSAHFENLETRFSFRTRILDYLWAELPIVATRGDGFANQIEKEKLGITADYENPAEIASAIENILNDQKLNDEIKDNIKRVKPQYYWKNIILPIVKLIETDQLKPKKIPAFQFMNESLNFYYAGLKKKLRKNG